jgi:phasin family protein
MPFDNAEFAKFFTAAPTVEWDAVIALQKRNLDAVSKAGHLVAEGVQTVLQRQAESASAALKEGIAIASAAATSKDVAQTLKAQAEFFQAALANGTSLLRELSEIASEKNQAAFEVLRARAAASAEEVKSLLKVA